MRRAGGNWSVSRIDKEHDFQTVLYEIDTLRFSFSQIVTPRDGAKYADVWVYLESFLVHYRNLLDFFGKPPTRTTDLSIENPAEIWSVDAGIDQKPSDEDIGQMRTLGRRLWEKYEDHTKREDTISRYLQHCTTYRKSFKEWFPVEMMHEIRQVLELFEAQLPKFKPATESHPIDPEHFMGGTSFSTFSASSHPADQQKER